MGIPIGNLPTGQDAPLSFWEEENKIMLALLLPILQEGAEKGVEGAEETLAQLGVFFDPTLAHADAAEWARAHTDDLLIQFGTTNQRVIGDILGNWIDTPGAKMGDLTASLARQLGGLDPKAPIPPAAMRRARMIGVTEVTRAFAQGEEQSNARAGFPAVVFGPPGHVSCRCWETPMRMPNGEWVIVWQTNRDEIVCYTQIAVPWSKKKVGGCRYLHGRIISEGKYLGQKYDDVLKALSK